MKNVLANHCCHYTSYLTEATSNIFYNRALLCNSNQLAQMPICLCTDLSLHWIVLCRIVGSLLQPGNFQLQLFRVTSTVSYWQHFHLLTGTQCEFIIKTLNQMHVLRSKDTRTCIIFNQWWTASGDAVFCHGCYCLPSQRYWHSLVQKLWTWCNLST